MNRNLTDEEKTLIKHTLILLASFAILFFVTGCASRAVLPAKAYYGDFPDYYEEVVKEYVSRRLKDPDSATYRVSTPIKGYLRRAPVVGGKPYLYGYIVILYVNAKNSFGGYTGFQEYRFLMQSGRIREQFWANDWFRESWYQQ